MTRFERDTAVEPVPAAPSRYRANIDEGWWILRGPNGGYLAAILMRAIEAAVGDPERTPRSLTIHYCSAPAAGECEVEARVERQGRSLSTVSGRMLQGDRVIALFVAAFSRGRDTFERSELPRPEAPLPEACEPTERNTKLGERYEYRWLPDAHPNAGSGRALIACWIRPREAQILDAALVAAYADALPPALFAAYDDYSHLGGLPTIDLTLHFHGPVPALPTDEFCLARFRTEVGREGFVTEDGEIWSREGQLLLQSRQLAIVTGGQ